VNNSDNLRVWVTLICRL